MLEVVTVPIAVGRDTPEVLGTLSAGFLLDDRRAEQFKRATASEIAFAVGRAHPRRDAAGGRARRAGRHAHAGRRSRLRLGGEEFMMTASRCHCRSGRQQAARDRACSCCVRARASCARCAAIRSRCSATAALAVLLATVLSYAVARSVTRPLGAITAAMRDMAATGDLTRKIALRGPAWWQDEDALLLASTFNTLIDSIARFQRETAQRERLLSLGRLSTVIAHEVRNPLMIIKAALRSLGPDTPPSELREAAADIDEQVSRLNRIVHDVLDFARPLRFELAPTDLAQLCRDAAAAVSRGRGDRCEDRGRRRAAARSSPTRSACGRRSSTCSPTPWRRCAPPGRPTPGAPPPGGDVVIPRPSRRGGARITVRDHGKGIDPDARRPDLRAVLHDPPHRHGPRPADHAQHHRGPRRRRSPCATSTPGTTVEITLPGHGSVTVQDGTADNEECNNER